MKVMQFSPETIVACALFHLMTGLTRAKSKRGKKRDEELKHKSDKKYKVNKLHKSPEFDLGKYNYILSDIFCNFPGFYVKEIQS